MKRRLFRLKSLSETIKIKLERETVKEKVEIYFKIRTFSKYNINHALNKSQKLNARKKNVEITVNCLTMKRLIDRKFSWLVRYWSDGIITAHLI